MHRQPPQGPDIVDRLQPGPAQVAQRLLLGLGGAVQ
jgi:hypothetical protein